jgi:hypothetical protein
MILSRIINHIIKTVRDLFSPTMRVANTAEFLGTERNGTRNDTIQVRAGGFSLNQPLPATNFINSETRLAHEIGLEADKGWEYIRKTQQLIHENHRSHIHDSIKAELAESLLESPQLTKSEQSTNPVFQSLENPIKIN